MIKLKTVTGEEFYLNCDLIYRIDVNFDTIITLVNGKTLRVSDTADEITEKIVQFRRRIMSPERKDRE